MIRISPAILLTALLPVSCAGEKPLLRFNENDLRGFYVFLKDRGLANQDPGRVFTMSKGVLRASGKEFGYLASEQEYENFRLSVDFKRGTEKHEPRKDMARDSGLLFHMAGPDQVWPQSIEFQVIEGGTGNLILVGGATVNYNPTLGPRNQGRVSPEGKLTGRVNIPGKLSGQPKSNVGSRPPYDLEKPHGQWNTLEVVADNGTFTHKVNGTDLGTITGASPRRGKILFQSEGAEIFFRNFVLVPLKR